MTEYKFIVMSELNLPIHILIHIIENTIASDININCTYQKRQYCIAKTEDKKIIKHILIAFKSNEYHIMTFKITNDEIILTIDSDLLDRPIKYIMKCTNNLQDMNREQLEQKIIELESRIDELQTDEFFITENMIDKKIIDDGSLLFNENNQKLFFEKLLKYHDKRDDVCKIINSVNENYYDHYSTDYQNTKGEKNLGLEHIYSNYELIYTNKIFKHEICIKGHFQILNNPIAREHKCDDYSKYKYHITIRYRYAQDMYTVFKKRVKPVLGKITVSKNLLKYELYNSEIIKSKCSIKIHVHGTWICDYNRESSGYKYDCINLTPMIQHYLFTKNERMYCGKYEKIYTS